MPAEDRLDLTGTACPMNFVRIKVALDGMPSGKVLTTLVDGGATADDLLRTLEAQGYEVVSRSDEGEAVVLRILSR